MGLIALEQTILLKGGYDLVYVLFDKMNDTGTYVAHTYKNRYDNRDERRVIDEGSMEKKFIRSLDRLLFTGSSISLVMPFIPVYVEQLGTPKDQIELFSGLAISVTAFAAAIVAPIWGNLADRKGRKMMMIRAAAGMTITMGSLAFVPNAYWL